MSVVQGPSGFAAFAARVFRAVVLLLVVTALLGMALRLAVVFVRYDFTVCTGITFDPPYAPLDTTRLHGEGGVRFVPLGAFSAETLRELQTYYDDTYGLTVEIASPLPEPAAAFDAGRGQLRSDVMIATLRAAHPQPAGEPLAVVGFVRDDMYIPGVKWRYAFSSRRGGHYAVVSTARLDYGCLGLLRASSTRVVERLRKMVTKDIGILYFGLSPSDDPRSVLYGSIGGPQDFDRMSDDF